MARGMSFTWVACRIKKKKKRNNLHPSHHHPGMLHEPSWKAVDLHGEVLTQLWLGFWKCKELMLESDFCLPLSGMCLFGACKRLGSVVNLKAYFVCSFVGCWVGGDIYTLMIQFKIPVTSFQ